MDDEGLVDRIYEAGLVPELWPGVLDEMGRRYGGIGALLMASGRGDPCVACSPGLDDIMADFIAGGWPARNRRLARAMARNLTGFTTERDLFDADELLADPMLTEFLLPRGIGGELGTVMRMPTGDDILITVQRRFDLGRPSAALMADADRLRPHLARAALFSARLGLERARAAAEMLHLLGLPAAVLAGAGRPLATNALFEALVPTLVLERHGRVGLVDARADTLLTEALNQIGRRGPSAGTRSIPVRADGAGPPAVAHLIPVRRSAHDVFTGASAVLLLAPVAAVPLPEAHILEGLFDLTPAEVRLARTVGAGATTLAAAAQALGLSRETAKTQLRAIFDKTGTHRQAELVSLLSGAAALAGARVPPIPDARPAEGRAAAPPASRDGGPRPPPGR